MVGITLSQNFGDRAYAESKNKYASARQLALLVTPYNSD